MTAAKKTISRRFPHIGWAWPDGGRHLLILAAICPDDERAFAAIGLWLARTDLDDATFAEHRLLSAITSRFNARLAHHPEYARLCGLQRLNWTRSRLAISTAMPVLEKMVREGVRIILLKGACRVALDMSEQKSRTSYDLDLLLDAQDFERAFEVLAADGWASTRGESTLGLRARLSSVRARNFKKGRFGDIDLHRFAYHTTSSSKHSDAQLFADIRPVDFYGLPVFIPCAEERLAMAIGHGGWDGQSHSDWLVDIARILESETVNWAKFRRIIKDRRLKGTASIALSYLDQEIGLRIPGEVLADICGRGGRATAPQLAAMLLAKEAESLSKGQKIARILVAGYQRMRQSGRDKSRDTPVFRTLTKAVTPDMAATVPADFATSQPVPFPTPVTQQAWVFEVTVAVPAPGKSRRIELELNSRTRNLCHLQAFHMRSGGRVVSARFKGEILMTPDAPPLVLTALPGKLIEEGPGSAAYQKYGALPFSIMDLAFTPKANRKL